MTHIIPSADLRNNFAQVERMAKESKEPIYLTKNGRGSLVIMDIDAFEEYHSEKAYKRFVDGALAETEKTCLSGISQYESMETAFEELLSEEGDEGGEVQVRNASA